MEVPRRNYTGMFVREEKNLCCQWFTFFFFLAVLELKKADSDESCIIIKTYWEYSQRIEYNSINQKELGCLTTLKFDSKRR